MKKLISISILALVALAFIAAPALADPMTKAKWWQNEKVAQKLNLTAEEKTTLENMFLDFRKDRLDLGHNLAKRKLELEEVMVQNVVNDDRAIQVHQELLNAQMELQKAQFAFLLKVRDTLGADRFRELKAIFEQYKQNRKARFRQGMRGQGQGQGRNQPPPPDRGGYGQRPPEDF